jgi:transposase
MKKVRVRHLSPSERRILKAKLRDKTMSVRVYERYRVIEESSNGFSAPEIADRVRCETDTVYLWIRHFNKDGFSAFERASNPKGRPATISRDQIRQLIRVATSRPEDLGLPFTQWSVAKLHAYCAERGMLPECSDEWVRRLLRREGLTPQRTKTWKESPDPEYEVKKTVSSTSTRNVRSEDG